MTAPVCDFQVFYDGSCPICSREIEVYKRQQGAQNVNWVDVSERVDDTLAPGLGRKQAMGRFHVVDREGEVHSGASAFAELWTVLPSFALLGRIAKFKPVTWVLEVAYRGFLRIRPTIGRIMNRRGLAAKSPDKPIR